MDAHGWLKLVHNSAHRRGVFQIARLDPQARSDIRDSSFAAPRSDERTHCVTFLDEAVGYMRADESGRAGQKNVHANLERADCETGATAAEPTNRTGYDCQMDQCGQSQLDHAGVSRNSQPSHMDR